MRRPIGFVAAAVAVVAVAVAWGAHTLYSTESQAGEVPRVGADPAPASEHAHHADHGDHHAGHGDHGVADAPARQEDLRPQIPDTVLVDQNGREHRFYTDLVKGNLVLMNAIYTSCQGSCPIQTTVFARVQKLLGDRLGKDVRMISVSLDPLTDTPEKLRAFMEQQKVDPEGWLFLTGPRPAVVEVLEAMDLYSPVPEEHTPIAAIGNEPAGLWMKTINLTAPAEILKRLEYVKQLGDERAAAAGE